ncbi:MAG: hypothetical protein HON70_05920, partial [Lentisphaerae bacterium]|nr:hypothetical protein [Lentisphaerota bacterium]
PIITPATDPTIGGNINGPSLIRVPDWAPGRLGTYYLYFAHHQGQFIRMAYSDTLTGPWTVYSPGVLDIEDAPFSRHIASPDVHIDHGQRCFRMYYHGCGPTGTVRAFPGQSTCYAESADGLSYASERNHIGPAYMRVFPWEGWHYAFSGGPDRRLLRSRTPNTFFEEGQALEVAGSELDTPEAIAADPELASCGRRMRHVALHRVESRLDIYLSNIGDTPERIRRTTLDLTQPWTSWHGSPFVEVLRPKHSWEGCNEPRERSIGGASHRPVHQLRDPYVYAEDGRVYLVYSVAGESGLAVAEIEE